MCELKSNYGEDFKLIYYDEKEIKECSKKDLEEKDRPDEFTLEENVYIRCKKKTFVI